MCTNNLTHRLDTESPHNNETAQLEAYAIGACVMVQGCQCGTGLKPLVGITSLALVEPTLSAELITQTCFRRGGTRGPSTGIASPLVFSCWHGCEAAGIFHFYWFAGARRIRAGLWYCTVPTGKAPFMGPGISWCSVAANLRQAIMSSFSFKLDLIERFFFQFCGRS